MAESGRRVSVDGGLWVVVMCMLICMVIGNSGLLLVIERRC